MEKLHELAQDILKDNLEKLLACEDDVRSNLNPEAVHDMRIAIRRLRAAIKTFGKILPKKAKTLRRELDQLFLMLGKKRDLDVFIAFIQSKSTPDPKLNRLVDHAQEQLMTMLDSKFYAKLITSLNKLNTKKSKKNCLEVGRKKIQKALKGILSLAPHIDSNCSDKTLHQFRIAAKKLRYICEFFKSTFKKSAHSLDPLIKKTKRVQDILGEHQDAIIGISTLKRYKNQFSKIELQKFTKSYELKKQKMRKAFFKFKLKFVDYLEVEYENKLKRLSR